MSKNLENRKKLNIRYPKKVNPLAIEGNDIFYASQGADVHVGNKFQFPGDFFESVGEFVFSEGSVVPFYIVTRNYKNRGRTPFKYLHRNTHTHVLSSEPDSVPYMNQMRNYLFRSKGTYSSFAFLSNPDSIHNPHGPKLTHSKFGEVAYALDSYYLEVGPQIKTSNFIIGRSGRYLLRLNGYYCYIIGEYLHVELQDQPNTYVRFYNNPHISFKKLLTYLSHDSTFTLVYKSQSYEFKYTSFEPDFLFKQGSRMMRKLFKENDIDEIFNQPNFLMRYYSINEFFNPRRAILYLFIIIARLGGLPLLHIFKEATDFEKEIKFYYDYKLDKAYRTTISENFYYTDELGKVKDSAKSNLRMRNDVSIYRGYTDFDSLFHAFEQKRKRKLLRI